MAYDFSDFKEKTEKAKQRLHSEFLKLNIGRASPSILDGVLVEAYGAKTPISNLGSISIEDPKTLLISPWDKSQIKETEKAIIASNLGLSVSVGDAGLRVHFLQMTEESRGKIVKTLKEKLEESRIAVRQARDFVWEDAQEKEKSGEISEDEKFRLKENLQTLTDNANTELLELFESKEKEVVTI